MAPTAQEKVSVDARGVLIMIVALAGIGALWVNEFRQADDGFDPSTYIYRSPQSPHKGHSREVTREPPKPVLLSLEDCGKLAQDAVREYVQRHAAEPRDDSAEDSAPTDDDEASKARDYEEASMTEEYRHGGSKAAARHAEAEDTSAQSEEEHEEAHAPELADSEEEASEEGETTGHEAEEESEEEEDEEEAESGEETEGEHAPEEEEEEEEEENSDEADAGLEAEEPEGSEEEGGSSEGDKSQEQEVEEEARAGPRSRKHIADVLGFRDIGSDDDKEEDALIQEILQELKKLSVNAIQPMEKLYKFKDISTRVLGDAEIFNKPMALFLGPWSAGKSSVINYLLGTEHTKAGLKTGPQPTDIDFTIVHYADKLQRASGTEMAAHWAFSSVNKFGQGFLDHFRGIGLPHPLLQKVTIVDTPGILDKRKVENYPFNDAFQWFIDRADAIYVVFDPSKLEIGEEMATLLDQLKGREAQTRFLLNKADFVQPHDIMRVTGQLLWNVSPLLGSSEAPVIHTVSMTSRPYHAGTPAEFFHEQELALLDHLREIMDERVENTIAYARRHAVRVRNHAKLVDCYLSTFYKQKGIFGSKKKVAEAITKEPNKYNIFEGLSRLNNVSRYDLPDPQVYYKFFKLNPVYEFKPLIDTCTYFKGCPLDKLDIAIAYDLPQLLGKYNDKTKLKKDHEKSATGQVPVPMGAEERRS